MGRTVISQCCALCHRAVVLWSHWLKGPSLFWASLVSEGFLCRAKHSFFFVSSFEITEHHRQETTPERLLVLTC